VRLRAVSALLAAAVPAVLATGCSGASTAGANGVRQWARGDRPLAAPVAGPTLAGGRLDTASLRGQVVVLNFWASWCPPCQDEAATLQQVYTDTKADGVAFVGVDVRDDRAAARTFTRTHRVGYPSVFDPSSETLLGFRRPALPTSPPTTLVLDRSGRVAAMVVGAADFTVLEPLVTRVAAERA
jgi:thiol-disulfide isomerase/thioredoxin